MASACLLAVLPKYLQSADALANLTSFCQLCLVHICLELVGWQVDLTVDDISIQQLPHSLARMSSSAAMQSARCVVFKSTEMLM